MWSATNFDYLCAVGSRCGSRAKRRNQSYGSKRGRTLRHINANAQPQTGHEQAISFACAGAYKSGAYTVLNMDFQYDPNFELSGGSHISFVVDDISIEKKLAFRGSSIFRLRLGHKLPSLVPDSAYKESNCGDFVTKTDIEAIQGSNWHGWIAEETFAKARGRCKPAREYTSRYRCVHVMVGNDRMTALLDGVCLLRKREFSLENGFSYDLFMDMLKTLRFKEE